MNSPRASPAVTRSAPMTRDTTSGRRIRLAKAGTSWAAHRDGGNVPCPPPRSLIKFVHAPGRARPPKLNSASSCDGLRGAADEPEVHVDAQATPRVEAGEAEAHARFRAGEALFVVDPDLTIVAWNDEAASLTGIPAADALGRPCSSVLAVRDDAGRLLCRPDCPLAREAFAGGGLSPRGGVAHGRAGARRGVPR